MGGPERPGAGAGPDRDPLTGLLDAPGFHATVEEAASHSGDDYFGLLMVELRHFERLELVHGPDVARMILRHVAERLSGLLRAGDRLARTGRDRFAILQARPHERLLARDVALAMDKPCCVAGHALRVGASIGMGFFPGDGRTAALLTRNVTLALHAAREARSSSYRFYTAGMDREARVTCAVENDLRRALANGELQLHYQPQHHMASGETVSCEALVRWRHPEHGLIPPARFVPVAEASGLIGGLGDWVLRTACAQLASWTATGAPIARVSVNVSALELADRHFPDRLGRIIRQTGVDPRALQLEVTESVALLDPELVAAVGRAVRDLGVSLAIDDFGSGFSSFNVLNLIPADTLKLDATLIAGLAPGARAEQAIVGSAVTLGHALGMFVVAEGVENAEQFEALSAMDCDLVQGHYVGRDMSAVGLDAFIAEGAALREASAVVAPAPAARPLRGDGG